MQNFGKSLVLGAVIALAACSQHGNSSESVASKAGPDGTRSFDATGFTGVEFAGSDNVIVKQGAAFSVVATGPQSVLDKLDIGVKDGVLVVSRKPQTLSWNNDKSAVVTVTMPALARAELSGSGEMTVDKAGGDSVAATLSGSGNLEIGNVTAKSVALSLAGSGDLSIKGGTATSGEYSLAGSGDIDAVGLKLATAEVAAAGSGNVQLTATTTADVSIVGSGDVKVGGGAKCDSSTVGSGEVSCS